MSLTTRQAFKFGFLYHCAEQGLTREQAEARIKTAAALLEKEATLGSLANTGLQALKSLGVYGLGASAAGGLGAGYGLAQLTEPQSDPEEIKKQELIATYKQQVDRIRRSMAARSYRDTATKPRAPMLR